MYKYIEFPAKFNCKHPVCLLTVTLKFIFQLKKQSLINELIQAPCACVHV